MGVLLQMREGFGWSQMDLAESLGVAVETISRWERAAAPSNPNNPFLSLLWASVNRSSARAYAYAKAMTPPELIESIRRDTSERVLYVGPQAVVIAVSKGVRRNWGIMRHAEGLSIASLIGPDDRALHLAHYDQEEEITQACDGRGFAFTSHEAPLGSTWPPWRRHVLVPIKPQLYQTISTPLTEAEYRALPRWEVLNTLDGDALANPCRGKRSISWTEQRHNTRRGGLSDFEQGSPH